MGGIPAGNKNRALSVSIGVKAPHALALALWTATCGSPQRLPRPEPVTESAHFRVLSRDTAVTDVDVATGVEGAERRYAVLSQLLGEERTPQGKITILLEGDRRSSQDTIAWVDEDGIHLSRVSGRDGGYWGFFDHELVHAFRASYIAEDRKQRWPYFMFIEEGIAEYLALEMNHERQVFSTFGLPLDVVAGYWVTAGRDIPMSDLRERHAELTGRCSAQAFSQRASWFSHIEQVYGWDKALEVAYMEVVPTSEAIEALLGIGYDALDAQWRAWAADRYADIPRADEVAATYRERLTGSDLRLRVCRAGVDY